LVGFCSWFVPFKKEFRISVLPERIEKNDPPQRKQMWGGAVFKRLNQLGRVAGGSFNNEGSDSDRRSAALQGGWSSASASKERLARACPTQRLLRPAPPK
ncbi:MAG: hypothetical protein ACYTFU_12690, partial [Planctomycetota bacterium]